MVTESIGYLAAILTTISFLPQVIKVWQTRSARDISLPMYSLFILGTALWLSYGVAIHSLPVALANAATLVLAGGVLVGTLKCGSG